MKSAVIIILVIVIAFLVYYIIKNTILPKKTTMAQTYLDQSNILKAIRMAKLAVEKDTEDAEAHFMLGKAFLADRRDEQAFREYRSASRLGISGKDIPETEFRETLAFLYAKFNEVEEALKEYVMLIKAHPENPGYYFQAGKLFSVRNKSDLAEQYYRKAISLNTKEPEYYFELGILYFSSKRIREATGVFGAALKLNPLDNRLLLYMGKCMKESKDYAEALPYLEKAARDQELKLRALVELGGCYMSLKMMDKAIMELERAVAIIKSEGDLDSMYAHYFLAMCFEKTKEYAKAIGQWEKIYAQKKNFRDVGEKLAKYRSYRQKESGTKS